MADLQPLGQASNSRFSSLRETVEREEQHLLLRLEAGGTRRLLAEVQEAANLIAKLSQRPVISQADFAPHQDTIISYREPKNRRCCTMHDWWLIDPE